MPARHVEPAINLTSFSCPHCGAVAHQDWFRGMALPLDESETPFIPDAEWLSALKNDHQVNDEQFEEFQSFYKNYCTKSPFFSDLKDDKYVFYLNNISISKCFSCKKLSLWRHDFLIFPQPLSGEEPNPDLPDDVLADYEEARAVFSASPRASAALLRLCVEKICRHVGDAKETLDKNIARLVGRGLDERIQKALDIVRVIGNESVHPGQIVLNDDRKTAVELFAIVNLIAEHFISREKRINALYDSLPREKLKGIEDRNRKAKLLPPPDQQN